MLDLLEAIAASLQDKYPTRTGFPQHVTLDVFRQIEADPYWNSLYAAEIHGPDRAISEAARATANRRIGKTVKAALGAQVVGTSPHLDGELIKTHALLVPSPAP